MDLLQRKPNRLLQYDYSQPGCYFITICTQGRANLFWKNGQPPETGVGADIIRPLPLSRYGDIVEDAIRSIPRHYSNVCVDQYVVMPNHIHMILGLGTNGRIISAPTKSVPIIVGQMKRIASKTAGFTLWQKGYHDHIIRNDADYLRIWEYIQTNPVKWREDCYFVPMGL